MFAFSCTLFPIGGDNSAYGNGTGEARNRQKYNMKKNEKNLQTSWKMLRIDCKWIDFSKK